MMTALCVRLPSSWILFAGFTETVKQTTRPNGGTERKAALCGVCPGGCGVIAIVEDGRLIKVGADIRCKKYESGLLRPDGRRF
jgi:hypothetical protein